MEQHLCHAIGCDVRCPPNRLMCAPHWFMVPEAQRRAVWRLYRPGQEVDRNPSQAYLEAARAAINSVAAAEGRDPLPEHAEVIKTIERILAKEQGKE